MKVNINTILYDSAKDMIKSCISEHSAVLRRKFRQTAVRDDYGNINVDGFCKEIHYFINKVLLPKSDNIDGGFGKVLRSTINTHTDFIVSNILEEIYKDDTENTLPSTQDDLITPKDYEILCTNILMNSGWLVRQVGGTGDQGVDIIAEKGGLRLAIQCKLYSNPVGNKAVQEIFAGKEWQDADYAVVVTNAGYTSSAIQLAAKNRVLLLHHDELGLIEERIGV